jgi:Uroporphyrinogen decarboxylase (URO-D)
MKLDTDTMNASERFLTVINHEEPDRVPHYVMGIHAYSRCYKEFWAKEDEIFEGEWGDNEENILLTPLGDYSMKYYFGGDVEMTGIGMKSNFSSLYLDKNEVLHDSLNATEDCNLKEGRTVSYSGTISGYRILDGGEKYSWYLDGYLKKKEDCIAWYDKNGWMAEKDVSKADVQSYNDCHAEYGDRVYYIPQIAGTQLYESTWVIMGQARWGYYCRKDPDYIHRLVKDRKDIQLKILDEIKKFKPKAVFSGDDMGQKGRPMMSPAMYKKFFKEPYREIFDKIHDMGAIAFNHSCGNVVELLPDMVDAGLDGWQSLEPASLIDHEFVKKKYGDTFLLVGGMDSREISFGSPESLKKHVKEQIQKMGKGGGYIAGPTHGYLTETPLENCIIMRDAIIKEGTYPLN